mmetsp:Transcript_22559/g.47473  ORF Transcript_22559/g.47473 Transcript_22559/m.47473 type:complete len:400 (+) Transcript_22559:532-1731(+)
MLSTSFFRALAKSLHLPVALDPGPKEPQTPLALSAYLQVWARAPVVVQARPDFTATEPAATVGPVAASAQWRLVHFVRDARRLVVSGFLYHSQEATPEAWLHLPLDPCSELTAYARAPKLGDRGMERAAVGSSARAAEERGDRISAVSRLARLADAVRLPLAASRFAEMREACVSLRERAYELASRSRLTISEGRRRNPSYAEALRGLLAENASAALQLDSLRAVPALLLMAANARVLSAHASDAVRVHQTSMEDFIATPAAAASNSSSASAQRAFKAKASSLVSFVLNDEAPASVSRASAPRISSSRVEMIAETVTREAFAPTSTQQRSFAAARATIGEQDGHVGGTPSPRHAQPPRSALHTTSTMASDAERRRWSAQLSDGSALAAVLMHVNAILNL